MEIAFEKSGGLVPAIIQDGRTGEVLMLGFMNAEALAETQRTREAVFFFFRQIEENGSVRTVAARTFDPTKVYAPGAKR